MTEEQIPTTQEMPEDQVRQIQELHARACLFADNVERLRLQMIEAQVLPDNMAVDLTAVAMMVGRRLALLIPDVDEDQVDEFFKKFEADVFASYERFLPLDVEVAEAAVEEVTDTRPTEEG